MSSTPTVDVAGHARTLHEQAVVVDATCPGVYWVDNFDKWLSGGATCCFMSVTGADPCRVAVTNIAALHRQIRENSDRLVLATTTGDIRRAKDDGKLAVVMQFQGTHPIEYDLNLVELYWRLGVRVAQLAYNQRSPVCDGCEEPADAGLSSFGHQVVGELNRLGIAVDLSHTGKRASHEAVEVSTSPCIVSHANAAAVHPSKRNLPDDLIQAVTANGGVIGLNGFPAFVAAKQQPTLDDLIDHLVHIDSLAGPGHVGLGIDYYQGSQQDYDKHVADGIWHPDSYPPPPWNFPAGIGDPSTLDRFTERMVQRGYADDEIRGVLGENWMRVLDGIWSNAQ